MAKNGINDSNVRVYFFSKSNRTYLDGTFHLFMARCGICLICKEWTNSDLKFFFWMILNCLFIKNPNPYGTLSLICLLIFLTWWLWWKIEFVDFNDFTFQASEIRAFVFTHFFLFSTTSWIERNADSFLSAIE